METQTVDRIIAIAVFRISAYGMTHIGRVDTDLILTTCLKLEFHEREVRGPVEDMIMGNGIFTAIVDWRGIGDIGLVVLKPVGDGALVLLHLA